MNRDHNGAGALFYGRGQPLYFAR